MNGVFGKSDSLLLAPRAYLRRLVTGALILNIFVAGLAAFFLLKSKAQYESRVAIQTQNLSQSLSQTFAGIIEKTGLSLLYLKREMEREIKNGTIEKDAVNKLLLDQKENIPELDGVRITNAKGDVVFQDKPDLPGLPAKNIADREHFIFARDHADAGIIISKPMVGRHSGRWQFNIDRRLNNPDGSFAGIVFASISLDYVVRLFASFDLGPKGVLTLRQADMTVMARHPDTSKSSIGSKTVSHQLTDLIKAGRTSGVYRNPGSVDPVERVFAFNKAGKYPLYITCGRAPSDYLQPWYDEVEQTLLLVCIFASGTLTATWLLYRNRKRIAASERLASEYDYLLTLFEHNGSGHVVASSSREILQVNQYFCELFGYRADELIGKSAEILHVDQQHFENWAPIFKEARHSKARTSAEYPWRRKDGSIFWCIFTGVKLPLPNGDIGVVWSVIDITERKEAEEALILFKSSVNNSSDAIGMATPEGRHYYQNAAFDNMFGDIGDDAASIYADQEIFKEVHEAVVAGGQWSGEVKMYGKYGQTLDVLLRAYANKDSNGKIVGLAAIHTDITKRKQIDEALRKSEELFRGIMALSPDIISIINAEGVLLYNSPATMAIHGYGQDDLLGKNTFELIHPDDQSAVTAAFENLLGDPSKTVVVQFRYRNKSGTYTWMEATGSNQLHNPVIKGIVAISRNIEDRKVAEQEHLKLEKQLLHAQKLESLGILAGGIAHDFNNLLTAIVGNLDLALLRLPPDLGVRNNIEHCMQASRRAADLTRQMLAYAGKGVFQKQAIDINEIVTGNTDLFRTVIPRNIFLKVAARDDLPRTLADPSQLQQIVMNLITNAAEAIGTRPGVINVATGATFCDWRYIQQSVLAEKPDPGMFVFIEVDDNGVGMNEEIRQRMFDPFFTTKFTGRGLGMAATQGIVKAHKGMIILESVEGKGTLFRILFPALETGAVDAAAATHPAGHETPGLLVDSRNKILIVDDEEYVRALGAEFARHFGYQPLEACNGAEAVEIYREQGGSIAVVVLDLTMPVMDGVATFVELKKINSDVRILLSSGYSEETIADRFPDEKPLGFLQKPFQAKDFEQKIREALPCPTEE